LERERQSRNTRAATNTTAMSSTPKGFTMAESYQPVPAQLMMKANTVAS